ncbi:MAG TPA: RNA polymerase subunit sigma [Rhizobium sp.]|nr:RNA polymerase subunit sigma [Rhizobium sp.]
MNNALRKPDQNPVVNALIDNKKQLMEITKNLVKSISVAEDIYQDAIIKAYGVKQSDIRCPIGYAFRMVYNLSIDESRRRRNRDHNHRSIEDVAELGSASPSALDHLIASETLRHVFDHLEMLPKRTNEAFVRHRLHGVPQKDIATELGVSRTLVNFMIKAAEEHCLRVIADEAA